MTPFERALDAALSASPQACEGRSFEPALRAVVAAAEAASSSEVRAPRPAWAVELGVELPCTAQDAKRAFRRLALATHPDRPGGSHDAFLRAQSAFAEAIAAARVASHGWAARRYGRSAPGVDRARSKYA